MSRSLYASYYLRIVVRKKIINIPVDFFVTSLETDFCSPGEYLLSQRRRLLDGAVDLLLELLPDARNTEEVRRSRLVVRFNQSALLTIDFRSFSIY